MGVPFTPCPKKLGEGGGNDVNCLIVTSSLVICMAPDSMFHSERIHQTLEYQTPNEVERKYRAALAA